MTDLSICIPAYAMGGQGAAFLAHSFAQLATQRAADFDVVVADQSDDTGVADVCTAFADRLAITRIDSRNVARTASANCNAALRVAKGGILKVLFQDDFLNGPDVCAQTIEAFKDDAALWALCGSGVSHDGITLERAMVPRLHPHIHYGKNTVSSPSVLALRRGHDIWFDEHLIWLMDVDFYGRAAKDLGAPLILPAPMVANRLHAGQVSAGVTRALQRRELRYVRRKFGPEAPSGDFQVFLRAYLKAMTPKSR